MDEVKECNRHSLTSVAILRNQKQLEFFYVCVCVLPAE